MVGKAGVDFEGTEEREWPRIDSRKPLDVRPVALYEVEVRDLPSVRRKQRYGADRSSVVGDYF